MIKFLSFFARFYSPKKFFSFITHMGKRLFFLKKILLLFFCLQDKDTPRAVKLVLMGALGYLLLPIDLIPDALFGFGWLDDAAVIALALKFAGTYVKPEHAVKARKYIPFGKE
jgi:uncharacterized membrane protein YkvA (DUF1232 family)